MLNAESEASRAVEEFCGALKKVVANVDVSSLESMLVEGVECFKLPDGVPVPKIVIEALEKDEEMSSDDISETLKGLKIKKSKSLIKSKIKKIKIIYQIKNQKNSNFLF